LALIGGTIGVFLGWHAIGPVVSLITAGSGAGIPITIARTVLLVALIATCLSGLAFGLLTASRFVRASRMQDRRQGARGTAGKSRHHVQSLLIVTETALTVVLLVAAGLLLRSFFNALNEDLGFDTERALVFDLTLSPIKAPEVDDRVRFVREVLESLEATPG